MDCYNLEASHIGLIYTPAMTCVASAHNPMSKTRHRALPSHKGAESTAYHVPGRDGENH